MQSAKQSLIETIVSTVVGFIFSMIVWEYIVKPGWNIKTDFISNFYITLVFTVASVIRGYGIRRFFNWFHRI